MDASTKGAQRSVTTAASHNYAADNTQQQQWQAAEQQRPCNGNNNNNNKNYNSSNNSSSGLTKDEVDFIVVGNRGNNSDIDYSNNSSSKKQQQRKRGKDENIPEISTTTTKTKNTDKKIGGGEKKKISTMERLALFSFSKKIVSQKAQQPPKQQQKSLLKSVPLSAAPQPAVPIGTPPRQHKFVKSASISRLLGNNYNAKRQAAKEESAAAEKRKFNTYGGRRRLSGPYLERFKNQAKEDGDAISCATSEDIAEDDDMWLMGREEPSICDGIEHYREPRNSCTIGVDDDLGSKAMRTLSRGLGKLWWRRSHSVDISPPDPEFKVSYLGNVLTGWAKGEGCVEKQLNTLWRNYTQNSKPDVLMRVRVCASGLKATTRQHGLTEYWANRITHCCAPPSFPRVFCWIYRHEGRKLKHELRCHAVLCSKDKIAQDICATLKENVESALREFKREKILKQNARLSLANAAYDNPSMPRRKILLSVGGNNYRPPLERSKSAPKLMAIEEAIGEDEDGGEVEETNEPEMMPCCQKDSLYPAMTLGRRRCRRGHSIRRTGKTRPTFLPSGQRVETESKCCGTEQCLISADAQRVVSYGSDDSDDFDKLLKHNDYDASTSLATELLPYFDLQLHKNGSSSLGDICVLQETASDGEPLSLLPTINSDPSAHPNADYEPHVHAEEDDDEETADLVTLRGRGACSDGEEDYMDAEHDAYFRQAAMLTMLHRRSMRKMAQLSLSSDESSIETNASLVCHQGQSSISSNASSTLTSVSAQEVVVVESGSAMTRQQQAQLLNAAPDSDEGSISSGCETASTATANQDDLSLTYRQSKPLLLTSISGDYSRIGEPPVGQMDPQSPVTVEEIYQRLESRLHGRHNSDATTFSSSSSITLKLGGNNSPTVSLNGLDEGTDNSQRQRRTRRQRSTSNSTNNNNVDTDSECSDESGYVEYQEQEPERDQKQSSSHNASLAKPQLPPKPMPRRLLSGAGNSNITGM